jgi:hypothetical protein
VTVPDSGDGTVAVSVTFDNTTWGDDGDAVTVIEPTTDPVIIEYAYEGLVFEL